MLYLPPAPQLAAFVVVAGLLTITPGADMALVMRYALAGGMRPAFFASLGIAVGCVIWGAASALGVSVIFARSAVAFAVLKYVGGAYLVYLGVRALREATRSGGPEGPPLRPTDGGRPNDGRSSIHRRDQAETSRPSLLRGSHGQWKALGQGLLTNLLNPKVAVFYVTFLPQFVVPDRPVLSQSIFLAATHVVMGLLWLTVYARFIDRMAAMLLTDRVRRRIEAVTGTVLMALGIRLALARR
ncbi:MAG TPA: LysE family translocator [Vicinamibacterales bacterium]|jgi:threonine/homoserine/homoserine lactone efflux protein|nr:LysE family translocator [Vicinamibacterales bacterium]